MQVAQQNSSNLLLDQIKDRLLMLDPVAFCERYLTLDGKPFRLTGNGYKHMVDLYRLVGIKALERDSKPIVILKSRQATLTTMACALEMFFMGSNFGTSGRPPIRIIHSFPQLDLAFAYSKVKCNAMIISSIIDAEQSKKLPKGAKPKSYMQAKIDQSAGSNDSLQYKQFENGNHLWIESVGVDGQRLRGKSCDIIFFDEIQDMPAAALGNSVKTLLKSQYGRVGDGVQVYFGTPKQRGSEFWNIWQQSSQQYFHLGCLKCKKHFPLYTPGTNDWEETWLYGFTVRCAHCGFEQDKRESAEKGKWIPLKDPSECQFIGFHVNQLYTPEFTKEKILAEKPGISAINTERAYQNEVLGEFFYGEASIISPDQIRQLCGDAESKFRASIPSEEEKLTFLGIDIGAKNDLLQLADSEKFRTQGQSYSTAVVITMSGPTRMEIVFATKFKRNDLASKKGLIDQIMRQYSCNLAICDIGYANDLNELLQTEYGPRFLSSQSLPKVNDHTKYNDQVFPRILAFEKDYWIATLFEEMKKGNIRFPLGDYEKIAWLIQHCTSMEIKPTISRTGDPKPHYVKGSTPNDGFMALLNAYLAYKFYISQGFKVKNPLNMSREPKKKALITTSYAPGMFGHNKK